MGAFGATEFILFFFVFGVGIILPLIALIDILRSKFKGNDNILYLLLVVLVPVIGPILYFIIGTQNKIKS